MPKFRSCHKAIMVITGRAHCYTFCIYIYIYIYINIYIYIYIFNNYTTSYISNNYTDEWYNCFILKRFYTESEWYNCFILRLKSQVKTNLLMTNSVPNILIYGHVVLLDNTQKYVCVVSYAHYFYTSVVAEMHRN